MLKIWFLLTLIAQW